MWDIDGGGTEANDVSAVGREVADGGALGRCGRPTPVESPRAKVTV